MKDLISIIIRTKNEERWISQCLRAVLGQSCGNFDYEIILVDNDSTDKTVEKARQLGVGNVVKCSEYLPGKALNLGISRSSGKYVAILSGHCIPASDRWLANLVKNFEDGTVAGVYGRQEPMEFTSDLDKRDLALVFGLDKRIQMKDSFFHNANSMIRRDVWVKIPFDEKVTNIEDRVWAKEVIAAGMKLVYEPEASVYHYHGIHQNANAERCASVVRIMENLHKDYEYKSLDIENMNIVALIPVKGAPQKLGDRNLLEYTIRHASRSKFIKKIIVSTDTKETADLAVRLGAEAPFIREASLSQDTVDLTRVYNYSLHKLEEIGILPDVVVCMEITFPFRPKGLIDDMIIHIAEKGFDSVVAARVENRAIWKENAGEISQLVDGIIPRQFKEPAFVELKGVGCVTHPEFLRQGRLIGDKVGIYEINDPYSHIEVRGREDFQMAALLIKEFEKA